MPPLKPIFLLPPIVNLQVLTLAYGKWEKMEIKWWGRKRTVTFLEIKRTSSLLCSFSLSLLMPSQNLCLNISCWIRLQLFILKWHVYVIKKTNKCHTSGQRRQTSKWHVLTIHDTSSSISLLRSRSLHFFSSLLRVCYVQKMSLEESHKISL